MVQLNGFYISGVWCILYYTLKCSNILPSVCGYHSGARSGKKKNIPLESDDPPLWQRRAAYDFTECLSHIDITYREDTQAVLRSIGYLEHNERCQNAILARCPPVPLHPHVTSVALRQLREGVG